MENAIVEKLGHLLRKGIRNECEVVYLLCQIRKLKYGGVEPPPFALKLFCNWSLHVELTHTGTTKEFMNEIDSYAANLLDGRENVLGDYRMLREFASFETFRSQLLEFFEKSGLPTDICDEGPKWHGFLEQYASVIEDCTLSCKSDGLEIVSEVVFCKGRSSSNDSHLPFQLVWQIHLKDQRVLEVAVEGSDSSGIKSIGSNITLHQPQGFALDACIDKSMVGTASDRVSSKTT